MNEWDHEDDCPRCGCEGCDECRDDESQEERDFARGICRECETRGEIQCRVHADAYFEMCRWQDEFYRLCVLARRGKRTKAVRKARRRLYCMRR